jgi:hypothetical protein
VEVSGVTESDKLNAANLGSAILKRVTYDGLKGEEVLAISSAIRWFAGLAVQVKDAPAVQLPPPGMAKVARVVDAPPAEPEPAEPEAPAPEPKNRKHK